MLRKSTPGCLQTFDFGLEKLFSSGWVPPRVTYRGPLGDPGLPIVAAIPPRNGQDTHYHVVLGFTTLCKHHSKYTTSQIHTQPANEVEFRQVRRKCAEPDQVCMAVSRFIENPIQKGFSEIQK